MRDAETETTGLYGREIQLSSYQHEAFLKSTVNAPLNKCRLGVFMGPPKATTTIHHTTVTRTLAEHRGE